jgi:hypothetical protein
LTNLHWQASEYLGQEQSFILSITIVVYSLAFAIPSAASANT